MTLALGASALAMVALGACGPGAGQSAAPAKVVLMTHDSFAISDSVLDTFEAANGAQIEVLRAGDAGEVVNKAILTRDAPLADVLYGVDNTFLSRALDADLFAPYVSAASSSLPEMLTAATDGRVTPIDYGDVCLNYDRSVFDDDDATASAAPPTQLVGLVDPAYAGTLVVENPATSSPGLAFLSSTVAHFGEDGEYTWLDYWRGLRDNDVLVVDDWDSAYYGSFSGGAGEGDRPIVVSYATSPVAEVLFADPPVTESPTGVIAQGCFRQVEYAGILKGTRAEPLAQKLVDYMLSNEFQQDIPLNMFVFPARSDVELPEVFQAHAAVVADPVLLDPHTLAQNRERWVEEWTDVVLR